MANDKIIIKGAREHNLKNVNLTLPREKLIVMTGLSGSGKSSLAFDTIYADGQRRYVESVFPLPVGPIISIFDFSISISSIVSDATRL